MKNTLKRKNKTRKGGMNEPTKINKKPTIEYPNNVSNGFNPTKLKTMNKLRELKIQPNPSLPTNYNRSLFSINKPEGFKGAGITQSKPRYPPLPETPTNKPEIYTNIEGLMPPQRGSEERQKRLNATLKRYQTVKGRTLKNIIFGVKKNTPPNRDRSYFPIGNSGFKPSKL